MLKHKIILVRIAGLDHYLWFWLVKKPRMFGYCDNQQEMKATVVFYAIVDSVELLQVISSFTSRVNLITAVKQYKYIVGQYMQYKYIRSIGPIGQRGPMMLYMNI